MIANIVIVLGALWLMNWSQKPKRACKCGRTKPFYFGKIHAKCRYTVLFWLYFLLAVIGDSHRAVQDIQGGHGLGFWHVVYTVTSSLFLLYCTRWIYYHEKDRLRRLSRGLGRVFVNKHGRLKVAS